MVELLDRETNQPVHFVCTHLDHAGASQSSELPLSVTSS